MEEKRDLFSDHKSSGSSEAQNGFPVDSTDEFMDELEEEVRYTGEEWASNLHPGAVGQTMFDLPSSKDDLITVVVPPENVRDIPSQSIVRIEDNADDGKERVFRGVVVEGPFHEPDGLRGDAPMFIATAVRGTNFTPRYHGRVSVEIMGEVDDGRLVPPRFRPLPNSPVFVLGPEETRDALNVKGDISVGLATGRDDIEVKIPSNSKAVLPRHLGVLGTTGGGKSTTVSGQIAEYQPAGIATVLIDTEGEYTHINEPTEDPDMLKALERRGKEPIGVEDTYLYHLVGRATSNPSHPNRIPFSLRFSRLSPYAVAEILELTPAQEERFLKAYDIAKTLLDKFDIFPSNKEEENRLRDLDELEEGYPRLTINMIYDVVKACTAEAKGELTDESGDPNFYIGTDKFYRNKKRFLREFKQIVKKSNLPGDKRSWFKVVGRLNEIRKLGIFDNSEAETLDYEALTTPGRVSIVDLGDTDSPRVRNLVIAELLRGVLEYQDESYREVQKQGGDLRKVMIFIEEAHEFLSRRRIKQMPTMREQVERIARRGRKRWLGLAFVTQSPEHLPSELLGLINSYVLHKIGDANVISRLKRSIGGVDDSLWRRLPNLAAGQAIVTTPSFSRPLLVTIDPTPCKLLMID